jgi:hypothetical protein
MNFIDQAIAQIRDCEEKIRALIELALAENRYEELAELARLGASLSKVLDHGGAPTRERSTDDHSTSNLPLEGPRPTDNSISSSSSPFISRKQPRPADFPRFERHGDRLIKLGWSKTDKSVYEHRAPLDVAQTVFSKLIPSTGKGGYLRMDKVLPIVMADKSEIPSYQAYLVLAWLRDRGAIQRQGNDGYKLVEKSMTKEKFNEYWQQTPERE